MACMDAPLEEDLQKFTDVGNGIHTMAFHLEARGEKHPGSDMFTAAATSVAGSP